MNEIIHEECSQEAVGRAVMWLCARYPVIKRIAFVIEEEGHEDLITATATTTGEPWDKFKGADLLERGAKYTREHEPEIL
jgi:hypothetical protein